MSILSLLISLSNYSKKKRIFKKMNCKTKNTNVRIVIDNWIYSKIKIYARKEPFSFFLSCFLV